VAAITSTGKFHVFGNRVSDPKTGASSNIATSGSNARTNVYMAFLLFSVAGLALIRFVGATICASLTCELPWLIGNRYYRLAVYWRLGPFLGWSASLGCTTIPQDLQRMHDVFRSTSRASLSSTTVRREAYRVYNKAKQHRVGCRLGVWKKPCKSFRRSTKAFRHHLQLHWWPYTRPSDSNGVSRTL
jgi:hypothetical protein